MPRILTGCALLLVLSAAGVAWIELEPQESAASPAIETSTTLPQTANAWGPVPDSNIAPADESGMKGAASVANDPPSAATSGTATDVSDADIQEILIHHPELQASVEAQLADPDPNVRREAARMALDLLATLHEQRAQAQRQ